MTEQEPQEDLLTVLKRALGRGGFIEFHKDRHHHVAQLEQLHVKGDTVTIEHPVVYVDYGNGQYVEMVENHPTFHQLDCSKTDFSAVEDKQFDGRHYLVMTPERHIHIYIGRPLAFAT